MFSIFWRKQKYTNATLSHKFKQTEEKSDQPESKTGLSFIQNNKEDIIKIVIYNSLMLLFGYLGETNVINLYISNFVGFIFFGLFNIFPLN